ncbi:RNA 3'-phosphate cyclase [Chthoniobacter flavus Ellin428]|uniref:RNA 3'-terminal phosphate cyclase n=1 Tax=Chthoniobacter flavus Ellin428 TaxID=497964 RepID=B4D8H6_9BACT|nr:RNA 3'-terminal phosphate cyclase [Chthoniobacter flavus]EDY17198.1 RNA 3'-phosphate cyclase [Chthoniobacter flavus Ellin428]TCO86977.1 RNA 3'-terminal phosphate cyclase (ATP) [Chthoniobacter flavus]
MSLLTIDGAAGEGGGQILRTSLALSLVTGQPFRIVNIRAGRKKPGLLRQHLTALQAATQIGNAAADGATIGSQELVFRPEAPRAGEYRFAVGTAGSTTLVLQTVLPALIRLGEPSRLILEGGTHNPFAPPFDFLARTFLPQLARLGPVVETHLVRPGFYPAGGGKLEITITPAKTLQPLDLLDRGADAARRVAAHLAALPASIAERAFEQFEKRLGWPRDAYEIVEHPAAYGPGFVLVAEVASEKIVEVFTGFGERGVRAEQVADGVIDHVRHYLAHTAPAGEYLTDQLLLPLALAGRGAFRTAGLSRHAQTNIAVIEQFLPQRFALRAADSDGTEVHIGAE